MGSCSSCRLCNAVLLNFVVIALSVAGSCRGSFVKALKPSAVRLQSVCRSLSCAVAPNDVMKEYNPPLYFQTPLLESLPLSIKYSRPVYLKLDALQPSGSFKDRGMAHLCSSLQQDGCTQIISSSGGNAGHSAAYIGRRLGLSVKVIVPKTTKPLMLEKIKQQGASVEVVGENWNQADLHARDLVEQSQGKAAYISPYEHELLWKGHSTLVDEILRDLGGVAPDAVFVSVGGGGLLCGVLEGLARHANARNVTVVAAETVGADSFRAAWEAQEIVSLDAITSVATSLGALSVSPTALSRAQQHAGEVLAVAVTDKEAVKACDVLSKDHRVLVEPACGAALAALHKMLTNDEESQIPGNGPIVVIVCGGSAITPQMLQELVSSAST